MASDAAKTEKVSQMADVAIATVRNLSYLLHPPLLDETGLRAALHWFIEGLSKRSKIEISLATRPATFPRLPSELETTIFRIVQEALTNVYRHSSSDRARVEIDKQADWVTVRVRDYGKGLAPEMGDNSANARMGVGISGMRERIRQFGGELTLTAAEPGTLVEAKIPLFGTIGFPIR